MSYTNHPQSIEANAASNSAPGSAAMNLHQMLQLGGNIASMNNAPSNSLNLPGRRNPSGDTPKGHSSYMAPPSGGSKGNFSMQHPAHQLPSLEVTPTSGYVL